MSTYVRADTIPSYVFYRLLRIQKGSRYLMANKIAAYLTGEKQKNQNYKEH